MKSEYIHIRCTEEQKEKIRTEAEARGLNLSAYVIIKLLYEGGETHAGKAIDATNA